MKGTIILGLLFGMALCRPDGYYHQQYQYKSSSSQYKNNELEHKNEDEEFYSKHGDTEGNTEPKVNSYSQHSEYTNPKYENQHLSNNHKLNVDDLFQQQGSLRHLDSQSLMETSDGSRYGALSSDNRRGYHQEPSTQNSYSSYSQPSGYRQQSGYSYSSSYSGSSNGNTEGIGNHHNPTNSQLNNIKAQLQTDLSRQLQNALTQQTQEKSASFSQSNSNYHTAQSNAQLRALEEQLKHNLTRQLQQALNQQYGNQGQRGGYSYTITTGGIYNPKANYNNQELEDLRQQLETSLLRQLQKSSSTQHTYETSQHSSYNQNQDTGLTRTRTEDSDDVSQTFEDQRPNYGSRATGNSYSSSYSNDRYRPNKYDTQEVEDLSRPSHLDQENYNSRRRTESSYSATSNTHHGTSGTQLYVPRIQLVDVQNQLKEDVEQQLQNALLERERKYNEDSLHIYSTSGRRQPAYDYDTELDNLIEELKQNLTTQLDTQLKKNYGRQEQRGSYSFTITTSNSHPRANYKVADLENWKQQTEDQLINELRHKLRQQHDRYIQRTSHTITVGQQAEPTDYDASQVRGSSQTSYNYGSTSHQQGYKSSTSPETADVNTHTGTQASNQKSFKILGIARNSGYEYTPGSTSHNSPQQFQDMRDELQADLTRQLQSALREQKRQHQQSEIYTIQSEYPVQQENYQNTLQHLTKELKQNLTEKLEETLRKHYGTQGQQGSLSYTVTTGGNFHPRANYNTQQLTDLTNQLQDDLVKQLEQELSQQQNSYRQYSTKSFSTSSNYKPISTRTTHSTGSFHIPSTNHQTFQKYNTMQFGQTSQTHQDATDLLDQDCDMQGDDNFTRQKDSIEIETQQQTDDFDQHNADDYLNQKQELAQRTEQNDKRHNYFTQQEINFGGQQKTEDEFESINQNSDEFSQFKLESQQKTNDDLTQQQEDSSLTQQIEEQSYGQLQNNNQQKQSHLSQQETDFDGQKKTEEEVGENSQRFKDFVQYTHRRQQEILNFTQKSEQNTEDELEDIKQTTDGISQFQFESQQKTNDDLKQQQEDSSLTQQIEEHSYGQLQNNNQQKQGNLSQQETNFDEQDINFGGQQKTEDEFESINQNSDEFSQFQLESQQKTNDLTQQQEDSSLTRQIEQNYEQQQDNGHQEHNYPTQQINFGDQQTIYNKLEQTHQKDEVSPFQLESQQKTNDDLTQQQEDLSLTQQTEQDEKIGQFQLGSQQKQNEDQTRNRELSFNTPNAQYGQYRKPSINDPKNKNEFGSMQSGTQQTNLDLLQQTDNNSGQIKQDDTVRDYTQENTQQANDYGLIQIGSQNKIEKTAQTGNQMNSIYLLTPNQQNEDFEQTQLGQQIEDLTDEGQQTEDEYLHTANHENGQLTQKLENNADDFTQQTEDEYLHTANQENDQLTQKQENSRFDQQAIKPIQNPIIENDADDLTQQTEDEFGFYTGQHSEIISNTEANTQFKPNRYHQRNYNLMTNTDSSHSTQIEEKPSRDIFSGQIHYGHPRKVEEQIYETTDDLQVPSIEKQYIQAVQTVRQEDTSNRHVNTYNTHHSPLSDSVQAKSELQNEKLHEINVELSTETVNTESEQSPEQKPGFWKKIGGKFEQAYDTVKNKTHSWADKIRTSVG